MARSASFRSRVVLKKVRWPLLSAVAPAVVLVRKRRDLGLPRPLSNVLAATAPLNVAAALPRGRTRNALLWAVHMWAYKVAFEIPYDRPDRVRSRLRVGQPLRFDSTLARAKPPTQRLQESLRTN